MAKKVMIPKRHDSQANALFIVMKRLPRELRDRIYSYVVGTPKDVLITTTTTQAGISFDIPRPPILAVCQQIRREAKLVYDNNLVYHINITDSVLSIASRNTVEEWKSTIRADYPGDRPDAAEGANAGVLRPLYWL